MKTLIIPDIHLNVDWAEDVINHEKPDLTIFLGDYFDNFNETQEQNTLRTANWLKKSLYLKNRIHLFGNHDVYYAYNSESCRNAGFTHVKNVIINSVLSTKDWNQLKWFHVFEMGPKIYICTHAGLSNLILNGDNPIDYLNQNKKYATSQLIKHDYHDFWRIGPTYGGKNLCGGITWCRPNEFFAIPDYHQFFGHTFQGKNQYNNFCIDGSDNFCLDGAQTTYAIVENDKVQIRYLSDD